MVDCPAEPGAEAVAVNFESFMIGMLALVRWFLALHLLRTFIISPPHHLTFSHAPVFNLIILHIHILPLTVCLANSK